MLYKCYVKLSNQFSIEFNLDKLNFIQQIKFLMNLLDQKMYLGDVTDHLSPSSFSYTMRFQSLDLDLLSEISTENHESNKQIQNFCTSQFEGVQAIHFNESQKQTQSSLEVLLDEYYMNYFLPRSYTEIRHSYVNKLISSGILHHEQRKKHRHLFIFDWDDTLFCTTYLGNFGFGHIQEGDQQFIEKLDKNVQAILEYSISKGDVFIITNAAKGWVEYSSSKYMPNTSQTMKKYSIQIISARSEFAEEFPNEIKKWKISAFKKLHSSENKHLLTNIICVGDSHIQMQAAQILATQFEKSLLKTVKFRQNPRIEQLLKQQDLVLNKLTQIVNSTKNLSIKLQKKGLGSKN